MKWRQYGRNAILVQFAEKADEWAFHKRRGMVEALRLKMPPRVVQFVPGYTTLLLEFDLSGDPIEELAAEAIRFLETHAREKVPLGPVLRIAVRYDGPDLQRVADQNGITVAKVIKYHCEPTYKVHLIGFSPGFPYLGELHHKLHTPRLPSPRPHVSAGSVAIGGQQTGIYTVDSPGGWNIIGHTDLRLFDLSRRTSEDEEGAFLLKAGDQVKFVPI